MIDARRGEVYAAAFARADAAACARDPAAARVVVAPCALAPEAFLARLEPAPARAIGTGAIAAREVIPARFPDCTVGGEADAFPSTGHLAGIAHRMPVIDAAALRALEPLYVRASGAERMRLRDADAGDGSEA